MATDKLGACVWSLWIGRRLEALASAFGIDGLIYAVMADNVGGTAATAPPELVPWTDVSAWLIFLADAF